MVNYSGAPVGIIQHAISGLFIRALKGGDIMTDLLEFLADVINQVDTVQFIELFKVKEIYLIDTDPCQIQIPLKWDNKMTLCLYITDELATLEYWDKTTGDIDTTQFITNYDLYNGLLNTIDNKFYI